MKILKKLDIRRDLHYKIFTLLNEMSGWGIAPSDIKILAELYNLDFEMANSKQVNTYDARMAILFSTETKQAIMDKLKLSYNTFNNSLTKLRKKGFIKDNTIDERRLYNLNKNSFEFTIEFLTEEAYEEIKKNKNS